jgi:hypothetical protein
MGSITMIPHHPFINFNQQKPCDFTNIPAIFWGASPAIFEDHEVIGGFSPPEK